MASLTEYIQRVRSKYPGNFATVDPFPKATLHAPTVLKEQTNRILVYKGSFSPPHIGHMAVLRHAFEHGGRDLNMIAAIVKPLERCSRPATATCSGKTISFGMEERVALWKSDDRLPALAWVYEDSIVELKRLMYCLVQTAKMDGYDLEFVALYGPDNSGWLDEPYWHWTAEVTLVDDDGEETEVAFEGCKIMMICDAARKAVEFDTRKLKRFEGCEPWRRPVLDSEVLMREGKAKAKHWMEVLKEKDLDEYQRLVDDAGSEAAAIGEIAKRSVAEVVLDNQHIVVCHARKDEKMLIRFVRLDRSAPGFKEMVVSGTILRNVIETEEAGMVREKVGEMALSPKVLCGMMGVEIGAGDRVDGGGIEDQGCIERCNGLVVWEDDNMPFQGEGS